MDVREMEPRTVMWAVAEVLWEDGGTPNHAPATIEDTSPSGACVRVKRPFDVGSRVTIKWHREQFSAIAKNCRSDGRDFLLGVRREADRNCALPGLPPTPAPTRAKPGLSEPAAAVANNLPVPPDARKMNAPAKPEIWPRSASVLPPKPADTPAVNAAPAKKGIQDQASALAQIDVPRRSTLAAARSPGSSSSFQKQGSSSRHERKVMASKSVFPKFWRRQQDEDAPNHGTLKEAPVNSSSSKAPAAEAVSGAGSDLLSYDDIYHAAGIMSPRSGYGIHKVVEMLNSQRIRELSTDIKRASVLMALDAAGTSVDDVLQDATRRQQALNSYEAAQRKQLEEFEAHKSREIAEIEAEMERIRAHYAQRMQSNRDQVAREKETLRNWQMAMQHESQRISEVIELCRKQPTASATASPDSPSTTAEKASSARA
jgi:hypothetical protein